MPDVEVIIRDQPTHKHIHINIFLFTASNSMNGRQCIKIVVADSRVYNDAIVCIIHGYISLQKQKLALWVFLCWHYWYQHSSWWVDMWESQGAIILLILDFTLAVALDAIILYLLSWNLYRSGKQDQLLINIQSFLNKSIALRFNFGCCHTG